MSTPADTASPKDVRALKNPIKDKKSGSVWPIFWFIVIGSLGWFLSDKELRRGLAEITGFKALEPVIEEVINKEFTIQLHGTWMSTCTQRVMLVAREKELDYDLELVDTANKAHKTADYLAKHPFGQIPLLQVGENDFLYESRAISSYLVRRYPKRGTQFVVEGLRNQVYADQALSIEAFDFDPLAATIFREVVMKPRSGGIPNDELVATTKLTLSSKLDGYERILSKQAYLAGPNITLADLFHVPYGVKLVDAGHGADLTDAKQRPHVAKWWKSLVERPSWQQVMKDVHEWQEAERKRKEEEEAEKQRQQEHA